MPTVTYRQEPDLAPEEFIDVLVPRSCSRWRSIRSARPTDDGAILMKLLVCLEAKRLGSAAHD